MSRTRDQLIRQVLDIVNNDGGGQSVDPEDAKLVDNVIEPATAMLRRQGIIDIQDTQEINDEVFLPLATYLTAFIPALIMPDANVIMQAQGMLSELRNDDAVNVVRATYY